MTISFCCFFVKRKCFILLFFVKLNVLFCCFCKKYMFYSVVFVKGEKDFSGDLPANPDTGAALGNDCCQVSAKKNATDISNLSFPCVLGVLKKWTNITRESKLVKKTCEP